MKKENNRNGSASRPESIHQGLVTQALDGIRIGRSIHGVLLDEHATPETRREITRQLINLMAKPPRTDIKSDHYSEGDLARRSFHNTWKDVLSDMREAGSVSPEQKIGFDRYSLQAHGAWSVESAAGLVEHDPRTYGYLDTIAYAVEEAEKSGDPIKTGCDVGTGAGALLAVALATKGTKVDAYELSPQAVQVAKQWVKVLGFGEEGDDHAINVIHGEATTADPPDKPYDLVVSETFDMALTNENGPYIMNVMSKRAKRILPDRAKVHVIDRYPSPDSLFWQDAGEVRFADLDYGSKRFQYVKGNVIVEGGGYSNIYVAVTYAYGDRDLPINIGESLITKPLKIGRVLLTSDGRYQGTFSYAMGMPSSVFAFEGGSSISDFVRLEPDTH